ncbi:MAG: hypothetical protein ACPL4E_09935 [Thermoproteota archaeon]
MIQSSKSSERALEFNVLRLLRSKWKVLRRRRLLKNVFETDWRSSENTDDKSNAKNSPPGETSLNIL